MAFKCIFLILIFKKKTTKKPAHRYNSGFEVLCLSFCTNRRIKSLLQGCLLICAPLSYFNIQYVRLCNMLCISEPVWSLSMWTSLSFSEWVETAVLWDPTDKQEDLKETPKGTQLLIKTTKALHMYSLRTLDLCHRQKPLKKHIQSLSAW